jgi:hypothetical protein
LPTKGGIASEFLERGGKVSAHDRCSQVEMADCVRKREDKLCAAV